MKFIVSSSYLLKHLQVLGGIINNNNTLPILDNFLFNLNQKSLTVSASDLETTISSQLEVESTEKGMVCITARLLLETLKTFPEQPLTFTVEDNNTIEISSNHGKYALAYAKKALQPIPLLLWRWSQIRQLPDNIFGSIPVHSGKSVHLTILS